ncbi:MAG TPA: D-aminoacylase [Bryobacteraceae bacterium]|nr:D-aminoacylase [Bryobacteraceae bacterium]
MHGAAAVLLALVTAHAALPEEFDIVIAGGRLIDGTGAPSRIADLGIHSDTIAAIGDLHASTARRRIEARGRVVTPGFIDIHSHARWRISGDPSAENYVRQGVTSVFDGNDGDSPLPLGPFLRQLAASPAAINLGMFAGQGSIRRAVMGDADRPATAAERERMRELVRQAMRDGAFGLSTGLFYVPGNYTPTEELIDLARTAGALGGIYISHLRDEAAGVLRSVEETIRIGAEARLPVQVTHHKIIGAPNWGRSRETLALIAQARARGVDVSVDAYPYTASSTSLAAALVPQWALAGGEQAVRARLNDPAARERILSAISGRIRNERGGGDPARIVLAHCGFDPRLDGRTLASVAAGGDAAAAALDLVRRGDCSAIFHAIAEEDVERILAAPFTMIASDGEIPAAGGVPHPRSYGTFARILGVYVREKHLLTLEEAVWKMTSLPAARLGLRDRGRLVRGAKADVVVFDPAAVADRATFARPRRFAAGFDDVLVNGRPVILGGVLTGERPGRVLTRESPAARTHPAAMSE